MAKFLRYEECPKCVERGADRARDNLAVYSDGGFHCFSCGNHHSGSRVADRVADKSLGGLNVDENKRVLPSDFTREVPVRAWAWLLQYGLSWKYWQPFVGWSEKHSRLVFTCGGGSSSEAGAVAFSCGRLIDTDAAGNKLEGRVGTIHDRKWHFYGNAHTRAEIITPPKETDLVGGPCVVLVEDVVSAHKVGQVTTCIPLFGTQVFPALIPVLRHLHLPVLMWLDQDQDKHSARRAAWTAVVTGLPVKYVSTVNDPKACSLDKIKEIVYNETV